MKEIKEVKEQKPNIEKLDMCRDDFIEWVLRFTNDDSDFKIYKSKYHITIYVNRNPFDL